MKGRRIHALLLLTAGLFWGCPEDPKDPIPTIPDAPVLLTALEVTHTSALLHWTDRSNNEDGFILEQKQGTLWIEVERTGNNENDYVVSGLTPQTEYRYRVFAFNDAGVSDPSNEYPFTTTSDEAPPAPTGVTATALAPSVVELTWHDTAPNPVSFVVDRRGASGGWTRIVQLPDNSDLYTDSTCTGGTLYYYRVGAMAGSFLTWSADSAEVTTPQAGSPHAPSDLQTQVFVGTGVGLTWTDNSLDEQEFHISRNLSGQNFRIIDTVEANVTTYMDSLFTSVGVYNYRVRSSGAAGVSAWSNVAEADYRYCSDGIVPICSGNYWIYSVSGDGSPYTRRRRISDVVYPGGVDYYTVVEDSLDGSLIVDTLCYWRNFEDGLYRIEFPLGGESERLLRYPPASGHWNFRGDSVIVTSMSTTVNVLGTTYTGVTIYQRFDRESNHSTKYFVKPLTVGIIREQEIVGSSVDIQRDLASYDIRN
jgi:hypothetical protein